MRIAIRRAAAALVVGASVLAVSMPVDRASSATPASLHGHRHNEDGGDWAGYAATTGTFTAVRANWVEPDATCTADRDLASPWVGIDGFGSTTVEQIGTDIGCSNGRTVHSAWYEMYPADSVYFDDPVAAGDRMSASVVRSGDVYSLTETDLTQHWSRTVRQTLAARNVSAEVIVEAPGSYLPAFGTMTFTGATINGRPLNTFSLVGMDARRDGRLLARTSAIGNSTRFSVRYVHE